MAATGVQPSCRSLSQLHHGYQVRLVSRFWALGDPPERSNQLPMPLGWRHSGRQLLGSCMVYWGSCHKRCPAAYCSSVNARSISEGPCLILPRWILSIGRCIETPIGLGIETSPTPLVTYKLECLTFLLDLRLAIFSLGGPLAVWLKASQIKE